MQTQPSDLMEIAKGSTFVQRSHIVMVAYVGKQWEVEVISMEGRCTTYVLQDVEDVEQMKLWWVTRFLPR